MKRIVFITFFVLMPFSVFAHQFQSDGTMRIMQHSDPDDSPIAASTTRLYLSFTDSEKKFSGTACDCIVYIAPYSEREDITSRGTKYVMGEGAFQSLYGENYVIEHVFPKKNVYAITVIGVPRDGTSFTPFQIEFPLRVERTSPDAPARPTSLPQEETPFMLYVILGVITIALISVMVALGILVVRRFRHK